MVGRQPKVLRSCHNIPTKKTESRCRHEKEHDRDFIQKKADLCLCTLKGRLAD